MSTGLNCRFYEKAPGQWYYDLEQYSYRDQYDTFGPFFTFGEAHKHLHANHANPGGYSIDALPGCKHDLKEPDKYQPGHYNCDRCGTHLDLRSDEQKRREKWWEALRHRSETLILAVLSQKGLTEKQRERIINAEIPAETLDKALAGAANYWAKLQAALDWPKSREAALRDAKAILPNAEYSEGEGNVIIKHRGHVPDDKREALRVLEEKHHVEVRFSSFGREIETWSISPVWV